MILATQAATSLRASSRLDAKFYCHEGVAAGERIEQMVTDRLGDVADTFVPNRFTRQYAVGGEESVPYLRPYDVFDYVPRPADLLSRSRSSNLADLLVEPGTILQTCSGRNLGPAVMADSFVSTFALSHDIVRVTVKPGGPSAEVVLAFMNSPTGQALLRRDMAGSVIDHLTEDQVADLRVPRFSDSLATKVTRLVRLAVQSRERARWSLTERAAQYEATLPPLEAMRASDGWSVRASQLSRLDAAFWSPRVTAARAAITAAGGVQLGTVADAQLPGRYKRYYVESSYGSPILSGGQLVQTRPVNLRCIADRSFRDPEEFRLHEGWVVLPAEGRSEEGIGVPVMVTRDRDGWMANNHVMRVIPRNGSDAAWIYLAMSLPQVMAQVEALACGSVVDSVYPPALLTVVLPPAPAPDVLNDVASAWEAFAEANVAEQQAVDLLEAAVGAAA